LLIVTIDYRWKRQSGADRLGDAWSLFLGFARAFDFVIGLSIERPILFVTRSIRFLIRPQKTVMAGKFWGTRFERDRRDDV
jgi:hypothetical protein